MAMGSIPRMNAERGGRGARARAGADVPKKKADLKKVMPEIWKLVRPRRWLLGFGFFLMAINRVAGLVLPFSTKFLIDKVLPKSGNPHLLLPLVGLVFTTTAIQALTSFSLTQLLSKEVQRRSRRSGRSSASGRRSTRR
jgi:ABC-type bacteriocin/lantibiotic exporter with double-glycine peptidase domain